MYGANWNQPPNTGLPPWGNVSNVTNVQTAPIQVTQSAPVVSNPAIQQLNPSNYTPEQWSQLQQQNWQQWVQWTQQYQQWQQQYGAEYQKSLQNFQAPGVVPPQAQFPQPNTAYQPPRPQQTASVAAPPPLPLVDTAKPPPPPETYSNVPVVGNQYGYGGQTPAFPQQMPNVVSVVPQIATVQQPNAPPSLFSLKFDQAPIKRKLDDAPVTETKIPRLDDKPVSQLSDAEKKFDEQFKAWEGQFMKWKEQNVNHPDKQQYKEYEAKWEQWRAQLLERREQMRKKRLAQQPAKVAEKVESFGNISSNVNLDAQAYGGVKTVNGNASKLSAVLSVEVIPSGNASVVGLTGSGYSGLDLTEPVGDFIPKTDPNGAIPGLDLVDDEKPVDEPKPTEPQNEPKTDLESISRNITSILEDKNILNMISMVAQQQKNLNVPSDVSQKRPDQSPLNKANNLTGISQTVDQSVAINNGGGVNMYNVPPPPPPISHATTIPPLVDFSKMPPNMLQKPPPAPDPPSFSQSEKNESRERYDGDYDDYTDQYRENEQNNDYDRYDEGFDDDYGYNERYNENNYDDGRYNDDYDDRNNRRGDDRYGGNNRYDDDNQPYDGKYDDNDGNIQKSNDRPAEIASIFDIKVTKPPALKPTDSNVIESPTAKKIEPTRPTTELTISQIRELETSKPVIAPIVIDHGHKPENAVFEPSFVHDYDHVAVMKEYEDAVFITLAKSFEYAHISKRFPELEVYWKPEQAKINSTRHYNERPNDSSRNRYDPHNRHQSDTVEDYAFPRNDKWVTRRDDDRTRRNRFDDKPDRTRWNDDYDDVRKRYDKRYADDERFDDKYRRHDEPERPERPTANRWSEKNFRDDDEPRHLFPVFKTEPVSPEPEKSTRLNITPIEDVLMPPGRATRPPRIVIIIRGPPGSGKTSLAKLIKDKETSQGGTARILSIDDYFMTETENDVIDPDSGRRLKQKEMIYEYEKEMESTYLCSLVKSFKKTITDGFFSFVIVDCVNDRVKSYEEMWSYAKQNGFQVYVCQMELNVRVCLERNVHNRNADEIKEIVERWEPTPAHHLTVDVTTLLQSAAISDVEMADVEDVSEDETMDGGVKEDDDDDDDVWQSSFFGNDKVPGTKSKWEKMENNFDKLARLDGINKPLRHSQSMKDYLTLDDEWEEPEEQTGKKRVRWADLVEKSKQEKMRAIGFVVGQTDWSRMLDPSEGKNALTQTKFIESCKSNKRF